MRQECRVKTKQLNARGERVMLHGAMERGKQTMKARD